MSRAAFEHDGAARVAGAIAPDDLRAMRDRAREVVAALELFEIAGARRPRGDDRALWELGRDPAFAPLPQAFARAVDDVFGAGVWTQVAGEEGGLFMPNLPCPGADVAWTASEVSWHVDEPCAPGAPARALIGYAFLDAVLPGGGATVALAGSHRRLAAIAEQRGAPMSYDDARVAQAELADLARVELTGAPGDLVLFDPRCLHTISANVSARPRLVMRLTGARA